jgi:hypothetical protein
MKVDTTYFFPELLVKLSIKNRTGGTPENVSLKFLLSGIQRRHRMHMKCGNNSNVIQLKESEFL